jgi:tetratricopeptide (TPR) repeat protein
MGALVLGFFIPGNFLLLFVLFVSLALLDLGQATLYGFPAKRGEKELVSTAYEELIEKNVTANNLTKPLVTVIGVVIVLLTAGALYFVGRAYAADITMRRGITSAFTTNNQVTYELQRQAILLNPFEADYRVIFAQTNMALANLISQQPELTEEQKQTVTQLVIQSINNGKLSVRLFPSAVTWENLGLLYTNLLNAVQGADSWTIALYQEALKLDPNNPALHLSLGGIHYSLGRFDAALQEFGIAIQLKGNYANAWYNAANAFRQMQNIEASRAAYQNTLNLVEKGSPDYIKALAEMDALPAAAPASSNQGLEELTPPESTPSAAIEEAPVQEVNPDVQVNEEQTVNATESGNLELQ